MPNIKMLPEISLHVMDIAENSVSAGADQIHIDIFINSTEDILILKISDNGRGMTPDQIKKAYETDPETSKSTASGLGLPLLKAAAQAASGELIIESRPGRGSTVTARFRLSDPNRKPMGDIGGVIRDLIIFHPDVDFICTYERDGEAIKIDGKEIKKQIADQIQVEEKMNEEHCRVTGD